MKAHDIVKMVEMLVRGYETLEKIVKPIHGLAINGILGDIRDGLDGKTSPEVVTAMLKDFQTAIASSDAAVEAKLHQKFDTSDEEPTK